MKPFDYSAVGFTETHAALAPMHGDRLLRIARWHRSQEPDDWPIDIGAPWLRLTSDRQCVFAFHSTGDGNADYAIGAELGLAHLKARRPFGAAGIPATPDPAAVTFFAFAEAIANGKLNEDTAHGFWGAHDTMLDAAMSSPNEHARGIARLDSIDHAECAARLEAICEGFTPPDLVIADAFGLLTRPGRIE